MSGQNIDLTSWTDADFQAALDQWVPENPTANADNGNEVFDAFAFSSDAKTGVNTDWTSWQGSVGCMTCGCNCSQTTQELKGLISAMKTE